MEKTLKGIHSFRSVAATTLLLLPIWNFRILMKAEERCDEHADDDDD